jgi:hypothetical protein
MYIILFDRLDRLGANIINYIAQIIFAYKNKYYIKYINNDRNNYKYINSVFVTCLFNFIDKYNESINNTLNNNISNCLVKMDNDYDWISIISYVTTDCKSDLITYFLNNIFDLIKNDFIKLTNEFKYNDKSLFDVNKTILVHLRLDDVSNRPDYDGSICSNYYKNKIANNEKCVCEFYNSINNQAPLSKEKLINIIKKAKDKYIDHEIILLSSPNSDTSFLNYPVIKNDDASYDLYLLSKCNVVILSRSTFALSSLFFSDNKKDVYIPLWGHFVCCGLDTIYDKNTYNYFY